MGNWNNFPISWKKGSKKAVFEEGKKRREENVKLSMQPAMKLEQLENTRRHKELSLHQNSVMAFFINLWSVDVAGQWNVGYMYSLDF